MIHILFSDIISWKVKKLGHSNTEIRPSISWLQVLYSLPEQSWHDTILLCSFTYRNMQSNSLCRRENIAKYILIDSSESVTGRKARDLQTEEIGCKCETFLSLLRGRRKQTSDIFFLLYTNLEEVSLKILCCHNDTWSHLKLTMLKPWVN